MTDVAQRLWHGLRGKQILGAPFYRRKPVGAYIVDFYCAAAQRVVEIDGGQHADPARHARDRRRDARL